MISLQDFRNKIGYRCRLRLQWESERAKNRTKGLDISQLRKKSLRGLK